MKTEADITNKVIRSKESIGPFKKPQILYACCAFCGLIALIFLYRPLLIRLRNAANRLHEVEAELLSQRAAISASEQSDVGGKIMSRNEVPLAIAELTKKGRELGLDFGSISPGELEKTTQARIRQLPISFTIESEYEDVGQFLAYVDKYPRSIAEVESLLMRARKKNLPELSVELLLNLYVEIENETQ